jgi:exodeoxyribonuclease VII small subunit
MTETAQQLSYEDAFAQLEQILETLETGDLPLEESLALYEQGAILASYCARKLDEAELRVRQWQPGHQTLPLEDWQEG